MCIIIEIFKGIRAHLPFVVVKKITIVEQVHLCLTKSLLQLLKLIVTTSSLHFCHLPNSHPNKRHDRKINE